MSSISCSTISASAARLLLDTVELDDSQDDDKEGDIFDTMEEDLMGGRRTFAVDEDVEEKGGGGDLGGVICSMGDLSTASEAVVAAVEEEVNVPKF